MFLSVLGGLSIYFALSSMTCKPRWGCLEQVKDTHNWEYTCDAAHWYPTTTKQWCTWFPYSASTMSLSFMVNQASKQCSPSDTLQSTGCSMHDEPEEHSRSKREVTESCNKRSHALLFLTSSYSFMFSGNTIRAQAIWENNVGVYSNIISAGWVDCFASLGCCSHQLSPARP